MKGIGNVTEYGTYTSTYSSPEISSIGKGMIVQNENVATFTAEDIGKYDSDGNLLLKGTMFFQPDDKKMESIDGKVGLYLYWKDTNGDRLDKNMVMGIEKATDKIFECIERSLNTTNTIFLFLVNKTNRFLLGYLN